MKIFDWAKRAIKAVTQRDKTGWFVDWAQGGQKTLAGVRVSNDSALQLSTVFACINNISEDVGKLPFKLYKTKGDRGKEPLPKHRVYSLLHDVPNPEMTAMTFRQVLTAHALSWGNGFAEIERGYDGTPVYLWPLKPNRVRVFRLEDNRIWYEITTDNDEKAWLRDDNVFHVPGLGFDGLVGYNVIRYARECLGAALATQKQAATFFGNGVRSGGMLKHPGELTDKSRDALRRAFAQYQGPDNAHRMMIIEEGMEFTPTTIPPEEAQFLETRQFTVPEICRWFRMPPNKVGDTTRAQGWSTLEQTNTDYVVDTLMPWLVRWEQEVWRKLLTSGEQRRGLYARHVVNGLLRGDISARKDFYATGRQWGYLSADDVRELEDMNPLPEGKGEIYLQPMNMVEAGEEPEQVIPTSPEPEEPPPQDALKALIFDAADRIASAEVREIGKVVAKAKDDREKFNKWVTKFFGAQRGYINKTLSPLLAATDAAAFLDAMVEQLTIEAIDAFTISDHLDDLLSFWKSERIEDITSLIRGGMENAYTQT